MRGEVVKGVKEVSTWKKSAFLERQESQRVAWEQWDKDARPVSNDCDFSVYTFAGCSYSRCIFVPLMTRRVQWVMRGGLIPPTQSESQRMDGKWGGPVLKPQVAVECMTYFQTLCKMENFPETGSLNLNFLCKRAKQPWAELRMILKAEHLLRRCRTWT